MDEYVPTIPFIRDKPRVGKTRKMMDKLLNRYFDKVVENEFIQQRLRGDQWRRLKSSFDSYMNLTPAERRRVPVAAMRGYQFLRSQQLLYSFEDNAVYNVDIDKTFNKLRVKSKNHDFSDMEKRAVFDNPFGYEPVSPYRVIFPTTEIRDMGGLQIVNIDDNIRAMSTAADNISSAADRMEATMNQLPQVMQNVFAQQNIEQNIDTQVQPKREPVEADMETVDLRNRPWLHGKYVYYNEPETGMLRHVIRGSNNYDDMIRKGWIDDGQYPEGYLNPPPHLRKSNDVTVQNTFQQNIGRLQEDLDSAFASHIDPVIVRLDQVITRLEELIASMNQHDVATHLANIYETLTNLSLTIQARDETLQRQSEREAGDLQPQVPTNPQSEEQLAKMFSLMEEVSRKLQGIGAQLTAIDETTHRNYGELSGLNQKYSRVVKSLSTGDDSLMKHMQDLANDQRALINAANEQMKQLKAIMDKPNLPALEDIKALMPPDGQEKFTKEEFIKFMKEQYDRVIFEVQAQNTILINSIPNARIANELKKITDLTTESMNKYDGKFAALNQETLTIRQQITDVENAVGTTQQLLNDSSTSIQKQISGVDNRVNVVGKAVGATQKLLNDTSASIQNQISGVDNLVNAVGNTVGATHQLLNDASTSIQNQISGVDSRVDSVGKAVGATQQLVNDRIGSVQSLVETMNRNRGMIENGDPNYMYRLPSSQQPTGNQLALTQGTTDLALQNEIYQRSIQLPVESSMLIGNDLDKVNQIVPILVNNDRVLGATINNSDIRDVKQDFVDFFEMLYIRLDNEAFNRFANEVGLTPLFSAFRQRSRNGFYRQLFRKIIDGTVTEQDLNEARKVISTVKQEQFDYEKMFRDTYNQLNDILNRRRQGMN